MSASPARTADIPADINEDELSVYMAVYFKARQSGKPGSKARAAGKRAVKARRAKAAAEKVSPAE